ncbi:MAG: class I SAM-dependent methyltransferase [Myxococcales bacterium]|nr:class I SAM-dependent methyltransferase [Myxococcales bacterium]
MADERSASRTALLVAAYRGRASARDNPVCRDRWAAPLAGEDGRQLTERFDRAFPHMELWVAVRTAYLDALVDRWTESVAQVVLLGAGLDTRAARLARRGVRFFEVDRPQSQEDKLRRLRAAPGYPVEAAAYVRCDFEAEDFLDRLGSSGFDRKQPALILWEGVIYYLTEDAARRTLRRIAQGCHPGTLLAFDYLRRKMADGSGRGSHQAARAEVEDLGEPVRFGIDDPLPMLFEEGFRQVRNLSFDQACLSITGTYERAREFAFQHIALAMPRADGALMLGA